MNSDAEHYDVFISYSSADVKGVSKMHRFLETYRPPGSISRGKLKIKAFRDKKDQGVTEDYSSTFKKRISEIPSFLLAGSSNSIKSIPVQEEVTHFLSTGKTSYIPVLMEGEAQQVFPENVQAEFPKAIYADLRMLKKSNLIKRMWRDRRKFKSEMLRIISSVLSTKTNTDITYELLVNREKQRTRKRMIFAGSILLTVFIALFFYIS